MSGVYTPSAWDFGHDPDQQFSAPISRPSRPKSAPLRPSKRSVIVDSWLESDLTPLTFGMYQGKTPVEIASLDADYIQWIVEKYPARAGLFSATLLSQISTPAES